MNDKTKKIIFSILGIIIVIGIAICFIIVVKNKKESEEDVTSNLTGSSASEINDKYETIDYGEAEELSSTTITKGGEYTLTGNYECINIWWKSGRKSN